MSNIEDMEKSQDDLTPKVGANSDTGVSTRSVPAGKDNKDEQPQWYAIRCTYGRVRKAYDYFVSKGIESFYPTLTTRKVKDGESVIQEENRLSNIFFARGTLKELKEYVFDNVHDETRHIRFYYNYHHGADKEPLVIPDRQMESLFLLCKSEAEDVLFEPFGIEKFKKGQHVLVKEGPFAGVEGVVARFQGQQRVGVYIDGLMTVLTAYVPSAFLEPVNTKT